MATRRKSRLACKTTSTGGKVCRVRSRSAGRTRTSQRLVKAIRAIDGNADLQGITHNTRELRKLLNFLIKDA